jgi:magnesium transporter
MVFTDFRDFKFVFVSGLTSDLEEVLANDYGIEELDIEDIFTSTQLAKIEARPNYTYVALEFPEYDKGTSKFLSKEIHTIISKDWFILIDKSGHKHSIQFNNLKENLYSTDITVMDLFYEMLDFFVTKDFRAVSRFKSEIQKLEIDIFNFDLRSDLVKDILIFKRNLLAFESIFLPLQDVVLDLQNKYSPLIKPEGIEKLDDTLDKIKKLLNILSNLISQANLLSESNEAQIARSTNETIKTLTAVNIIALVPTILFSFFGMNVYFGYLGNTANFIPLLIIILFSAIVSVTSYWYFRKKGWI